MIAKLIARASSLPRALLLTLPVMAAALLWAYWPTLAGMAHRWTTDPQYSHGYLVPLFAVVILVLRRDRLAAVSFAYHWSGVALVGGAVLLRLAGTYLYFDWLDVVSLLPCLAGLAVLLGGGPALRWSWPAIAFLAFMIPLPFRLEVAAAVPLQTLATGASTYALQTLGVTAFAEGNIIQLEGGAIGVVRACNGLSMLLIFFAMATAVAILFRRVWWERLVVVASAVPIALFVNVIRISATGVLYETAGPHLAELIFHDLAGWLMMPLALALLAVELWVLTRLLVVPRAAASEPVCAPPQPVVRERKSRSHRRRRSEKPNPTGVHKA